MDYYSEVILITGAAGSIGKELTLNFLAVNDVQLVLVDISEIGMFQLLEEINIKYPKLAVNYFIESISNKEFVQYLFKEFSFKRVFHAAAYKHVALMEANPCSAIVSNIYGAQLIIDYSIINNVSQLVIISTDKAVKPINTMGRTKNVIEKYAGLRSEESHKTNLIVLRLCNIYSSSGSVVPIFKSRIAQNLPLIIKDSKLIRSFIKPKEVRNIFNYIFHNSNLKGIYIPNNSNEIFIQKIASKVLKGSNKDATVYPIVYTYLPEDEKLKEELLNTNEYRIKLTNAPVDLLDTYKPTSLNTVLLEECIQDAKMYQIDSSIEKLILLSSN
ncbi:polysaccharide biosynthesis protein [Leeuwenhoekiella aequorea]|uniref:Polysaccharide biosynthesis protein n=1 Tax=Leeuwenhoekiella aequorea TaxID=283736 RepID=A0A4Q0P4P1_9FLAO|nr:polysaccharide biosynthesis protein [Leeuwenhoekiella aequorea]RXG21088.1 polysaccharide biosynthesis protein [Leeuwenhoekiella aequorea]